MNRTTMILLGVAGVLVGNIAIGYAFSTARTGRMPGQNTLLDLNDTLLRYNPLARLFPQASGPAVAAIPVPGGGPTTFPTLAQPQVTQSSGGTTTYYG